MNERPPDDKQRVSSEAGRDAPGGSPRIPLILRLARGSYYVARRILIGVVGVSVILVGVIMTVTPGPAIVVIPVGLAILALEFAWARRLLRLFRVRSRQMARDQRRGNYRFWSRWWRRR